MIVLTPVLQHFNGDYHALAFETTASLFPYTGRIPVAFHPRLPRLDGRVRQSGRHHRRLAAQCRTELTRRVILVRMTKPSVHSYISGPHLLTVPAAKMPQTIQQPARATINVAGGCISDEVKLPTVRTAIIR